MSKQLDRMLMFLAYITVGTIGILAPLMIIVLTRVAGLEELTRVSLLVFGVIWVFGLFGVEGRRRQPRGLEPAWSERDQEKWTIE